MSILTHSYRRILALPQFASTKSVFFDGVGADLRFADGVFNSLGDGSVSMWIRPSTISVAILFGCTQNAVSGYVALTLRTGGLIGISGRPTGLADTYLLNSPAGSILVDTWYHIAWTKTGTTHNLYINGVDQVLTPVVDTNRDIYFSDLTGTRRYTFGNFRRATNGNYYHGYMDEFVISPTAWSQAQVTALYNNGCPGNLAIHSDYANMITWSRMGDGTGDAYPTIVDQIGANDLTMTNMVAGDIVSVTPC